MIDLFQVARLKVARAEEHLRVVEQEIANCLATEPVPLEQQTTPAEPSVIGDPRAAPPAHLTCVVGDCLSNLRTALELVFWALALETGPKDPNRDRIAFPMFSNEAKFRAAEDGIARHVSAEALRALKAVQPFRTHNAALTALWTLSNRDRHGFLVLRIRHAAVDGRDVPIVAFADRTVPAIPVERLLAAILRHVKIDVLPKFEEFGS